MFIKTNMINIFNNDRKVGYPLNISYLVTYTGFTHEDFCRSSSGYSLLVLPIAFTHAT